MDPTGQRCTIYDEIDAMGDSTSVAELVRRLKPILNKLAYYAVNSEAAVMDTREEWHTEYKEQLFIESAADRPKPAVPGASPVPASRAHKTPAPSARPPAGRAQKGPAPTARVLPARTDASNLPPSLRAIMEGTHSSFKDVD